MLLANVLARLDATRSQLEQKQKDLNRLDNLIKTMQQQRKNIYEDICTLECRIDELEEELDG